MLSGSCTNLADLVEGGSTAAPNGGGMPTRRLSKVPRSEDSESAASGERQSRVILVSNALPLRAKAGAAGDKYAFEWDQDALVGQIKLGVTGDGTQAEPLTTAFAQKTVLFVGSLPVEVEDSEQERVYAEVYKKFGCVPVYIPSETKALFYKGFCKVRQPCRRRPPTAPTATAHGGTDAPPPFARRPPCEKTNCPRTVHTLANHALPHAAHAQVRPALRPPDVAGVDCREQALCEPRCRNHQPG